MYSSTSTSCCRCDPENFSRISDFSRIFKTCRRATFLFWRQLTLTKFKFYSIRKVWIGYLNVSFGFALDIFLQFLHYFDTVYSVYGIIINLFWWFYAYNWQVRKLQFFHFRWIWNLKSSSQTPRLWSKMHLETFSQILLWKIFFQFFTSNLAP